MPSSPIAAIADQIWLSHDGGERPVEPDTLVVIRFRHGGESGPYPAKRWRWRSWAPGVRDPHDIVEWCREARP